MNQVLDKVKFILLTIVVILLRSTACYDAINIVVKINIEQIYHILFNTIDENLSTFSGLILSKQLSFEHEFCASLIPPPPPPPDSQLLDPLIWKSSSSNFMHIRHIRTGYICCFSISVVLSNLAQFIVKIVKTEDVKMKISVCCATAKSAACIKDQYWLTAWSRCLILMCIWCCIMSMPNRFFPNLYIARFCVT